MRCIRLQRNNYGDIITIGEYVKYKQPAVFKTLNIRFILTILNKTKNVTEKVLQTTDISFEDKSYVILMSERPKPGKGGLLAWEKEEVLYK